MAFQEVFSSVNAMLFRQNTHKTGNNAIEMSQVSHSLNVSQILTCLNMCSMSFKTGKRMLYNFI